MDNLEVAREHIIEFLNPISKYASEYGFKLEFKNNYNECIGLVSYLEKEAIKPYNFVCSLNIGFNRLGIVFLESGMYKYITAQECISYGYYGYMEISKMWTYICKQIYLYDVFNKLTLEFKGRIAERFTRCSSDVMLIHGLDNECLIQVRHDYSMPNLEMHLGSPVIEVQEDNKVFNIGDYNVVKTTLEEALEKKSGK